MRLIPDHVWAAMTIWCEARGEPQEGRIAVAEVIRNRIRRRYQSDGTMAGTVLRPFQFSCFNTRDPNRIRAAELDDDQEIVRECLDAWSVALNGSDVAKGGLLYLNPLAVVTLPEWAVESREVAIIGRHHFYVPE